MKLKVFSFVAIMVFGWVVSAPHALAAEPCAAGAECISLENPISRVSNVPQFIGVLVRGALGIIGGLTLLMFIWGGFQWLISAGNAERVETGTQTMLWAAIGVVIVFSSYFIVNEILNNFASRTSSNNANSQTLGSASDAVLPSAGESPGCMCTFEVAGTGCTVRLDTSFSFGQNVTVQDLLDKVSIADCPAKLAAGAVVDTKQKIDVTKENCASANRLSGQSSGYTYAVACSIRP